MGLVLIGNEVADCHSTTHSDAHIANQYALSRANGDHQLRADVDRDSREQSGFGESPFRE